MKMKRTIWLFVLLVFAITYSSSVSAKIKMGTITIKVGETYFVEAVPNDGAYTATGSWSKSNSHFVITASGNISCKIRGNTVGSGTLSYSGYVAISGTWTTEHWDLYWDVEVLPADVKVTSISLNSSSLSVAVGATKQLTATVLPSNATNKSVTWSSNNTSVATVTSSGNVTGKSDGTATITCTANDGSGVKGYCTVTVRAQKFKATTIEGVEVLYQVVDEDAKTCRVGFYDKGSDWSPTRAINESTTGSITIPERVNGYKVVEVCEEAFRSCYNITDIHFPNSVTTIGSYAFWNCKALNSITGIENLEYIGSATFDYTPWYEKIADGPIYIGKILYGYKGNMPQNTIFEVKEGTTCISSLSHYNLFGIIIPKSVKYIGPVKNEYYNIDNPFFKNYSGGQLSSIIVSSENETYDSRDNCNAVIDKKTNKLVAGCKGTVIPSSVTTIGEGAFSGSNHESVIIPDHVKIIEKNAFYASDFVSLSIGSGLESIGEEAFSSTSECAKIRVSESNTHYDSRDNCNAIIETSTNKLIRGAYTAVIPESVKSLGQWSIYVQNSGRSRSLYVPDGVEKIEKNAIQGFISSIYLGTGVKKIESGAFTTSAIAIHCKTNTPPEIDSEWLYDGSYGYKHTTLFVPLGSKSRYQNAKGWSKFENIVEGDGHMEEEIIMANTAEGHLLRYKITSETGKTCELLGALDNSISGKLTIPERVEGYSVTSIANRAFERKWRADGKYDVIKISEVELPSTLLSIGEQAFYYCEFLSSVTGGENVEEIGNSAFYGTDWLNNLPDGDIYIGKVFLKHKGKESTEVVIKQWTKTICNDAIGSSTNPMSVTIPKSVSRIERPFSSGANINRIVVEEGNKTYDSRKDCNAIIETSTNKLIAGCNGTVVPNTIKVIGSYAFYAGRNLSKLVIPNSVDTLQNYALREMTGLRTLTIGSGVKSIGSKVLFYSNKVSAIHSLIREPFDIDDNVFENDLYSKAKLYVPIGTKAKYLAAKGWKEFTTIVEIGDNELMEDEEFTSESSNNLTFRVISMSDKTCEVASCNKETIGKVTIPSVVKDYTVKAIGQSAFYNCEEITEISMPNTIEEIKYDGIYSCGKLTSVSLPSSLKALANYALAYNPFTTITIPKSVETMTGNPLLGDSLLTTISVEEGNKVYESPIGSNCIVEKTTKTLIAGCQTTVIPEDIITIGNNAFYYQRKLREITIPASVDTIKSYAFSSTGLTNIVLPEKVRYLGSSSLGYNRITSITIPKSVEKIDGNPLMGDSLLTTITVEDGNRAYESPEGSNAIVEKATKMLMAGCQTTVIPNTVKRIGDRAFYAQKKITFMPIPNSVDSIGSYVFYDTPLMKVVLPASLKTIADYAFYNYGHTIPVVKSLITNPQALPYSTFSTETHNNGKLIVPQGTAELYKATDYWNRFKNIVEAGPAPTGITLPTAINVVMGEKLTLEPTFTPANADADLTWSSDDATIATVSADGVVTGVSVGQTFINVMTDNGKYGWSKVTVTKPLPTAIALPKNATVGVGASVSLTPTFTPEGAGSELTWSVDDESIAKVDANGVVTGVSEGLTVITATTSNGIVSNPCKITVTRNVDAIQEVNNDSNTVSTTYNLSGQRVATPRKGINIVGGKKVIVK